MTYFDDAMQAGEDKFRADIDAVVQRLIRERDASDLAASTANADNANLRITLDTLRADLAAAHARIAELEAGNPEPDPDPEPEPTKLTRIGMSSPANLWTQRLNEVGPTGITCRRIYADLTPDGITQRDTIQTAIRAGLTPVVSFKFPNIETAGNGGYNTWADLAAQQLDSYGTTILVAAWHEPSDNMTGAQFLAFQRQLMPRFQAKRNLKTFCINHGWLLDRNVAKFSEYSAPDVMNLWDLYGIDTYQSGTMTNPGDREPHHRITALVKWLDDQGVPDKPIIIGEYSAYTGDAMRRAGEAILSTPNIDYAINFNSNVGGKGEPLAPGTDRLEAFKATKRDPRAMQ